MPTITSFAKQPVRRGTKELLLKTARQENARAMSQFDRIAFRFGSVSAFINAVARFVEATKTDLVKPSDVMEWKREQRIRSEHQELIPWIARLDGVYVKPEDYYPGLMPLSALQLRYLNQNKAFTPTEVVKAYDSLDKVLAKARKEDTKVKIKQYKERKEAKALDDLLALGPGKK